MLQRHQRSRPPSHSERDDLQHPTPDLPATPAAAAAASAMAAAPQWASGSQDDCALSEECSQYPYRKNSLAVSLEELIHRTSLVLAAQIAI